MNSNENRRNKMRLRAIALTTAVIGMVIGAVIEMFVQGAMEATGWFGPTLEEVVEEQIANFDTLEQKLDKLARTEDVGERKRLLEEVGALVGGQERLTRRTHRELQAYEKQVQELKNRALNESGVAGGADFWLVPGESVTLVTRENVLALLRLYDTGKGRFNFRGETVDLMPGEFIEFSADAETFKLIYKQTAKTGQRRAGFDLVRLTEE